MKYRGQDMYEIAEGSEFYIGKVANTSSILTYNASSKKQQILLAPASSRRGRHQPAEVQASISHRVASMHGIDRASWISSHAM